MSALATCSGKLVTLKAVGRLSLNLNFFTCPKNCFGPEGMSFEPRQTLLHTSTLNGGNRHYDRSTKYDLCFVFELTPEKAGALVDVAKEVECRVKKSFLSASEVEDWILRICVARDFPESKGDSFAVPIDRGLSSIPAMYGLSHKNVKRMAVKDFEHMIVQLFKRMAALLDADVGEMKTVDGDELFVFIHLREEGAKQISHKVKYPLLLDAEAIPALYKDNPDYAPPHIHYDERIEDPIHGMDCVRRCGRAFQRYDGDGRKVKFHPDLKQSMFTDIDRARLLLLGICDLFNLEEMMSFGVLKSYYMPPNQHKLKHLISSWASWKRLFNTTRPDDVRDYFGEDIALYFAWVHEFLHSLLVPTVAATSFYLMKLWWGKNHSLDRTWVNLARVGLSILTSTWCAWLNQRWELMQELYALRWGSTKLDSAITIRQERQGYRAEVFKKDPVNPERTIKWYSTAKWRARRMFSDAISTVCLIITVFVVNEDLHEWLFSKFGIQDRLAETLQAFIPSLFLNFFSPAQLLVAILAYTFDMAYMWIAQYLLDYENHKYHKTYQRSQIRKLFTFAAVDYFIPLYHLAFTKMYTAPCYDEDPQEGRCLKSLHEQIRSILVVTLLGNILELGIPYVISIVKIHLKTKKAKEKGEKGLDRYEEDYCRAEYNGTMEDYQEVIMMYLLLALFTNIFSLLPLIFFVFLLLEIRVDAIKLTRLTRRPFPQTCRNIGAWTAVMATVSNITIITNICLCTFTTFGKPYPLGKKLLFTLVTTVICFAMRELIRWHRPPLQQRVDLLRQQQAVAEYIAMWGVDTDAAVKLNLNYRKV
eukprot:Blabericola_migrator_1__9295@NODE_49_length_16431_cov_119_110181_g45_i0_p3_GENE_NODE_49_length_16431_cov_119_110181_g45_i0NODE_49_length_16431_cov_119_110181_g45_i0_p3_ORF_typecomplete_len816_score135_49Anoctamin/PF04547_12/2_1e73YdjM/PF04307_14/0_51YdjM/PF04307_14/2_8e03_NODE_49_length_16431_cov_119_110181_g45_i054357882